MKTLFGDINARETEEQAAFVQWFEYRFPKVRILAIPNGAHLAGDAKQRAIQMARLKREGLKRGVPDLQVPLWRLWIELKRVKGGVFSAEQDDWAAYLRDGGHTVIQARGCDDAMDQVEVFADREALRTWNVYSTMRGAGE